MLKVGETLILASNNAGKLQEMRAIVGTLGLNLQPIGEYTKDEPVEDGGTFIANALIKARAAVAATGRTALADDSGLSIPVLDGRPGVETKPFVNSCGGYDQATLAILKEAGVPQTPAFFTCVLALVKPDGTHDIIEGKIHGMLTYPASGDAGFGFDPYFIPDGYTDSMAALGMDVKNTISHRALALKQLVELLSK